ncbi:BON domain-containing protein [Botrimarina mediterranea]|uniref:BON domain protein n=1 Tax=Botrimarina mediterranea TaxID=2528022 RepID=A0A518K724_9BACT|nr:BON domain-containing protein [Botrimarina mediterranea]QDV73580.1 BON domain protein [Botrimarina mediterranea]QDV78171.1 BON domain protein [Planctomycetes bacterium K2D]
MVALQNPAAKAACPLHDAVTAALASSPYVAPTARLRIEAGDGRVRLHGDVGTFFEKQMAQEVVRRIDGVQQVENLLQVAWT